MLDVLDNILENINHNESVQLSNLEVIPQNTILILTSVFHHCKIR